MNGFNGFIKKVAYRENAARGSKFGFLAPEEHKNLKINKLQSIKTNYSCEKASEKMEIKKH